MTLVPRTYSDRLIAVCLVGATIAITAWQHLAAEEPLRNFVTHDTPKSVRPINFDDAQGQIRSLDDFKDKVVVVNLWATWCVPCRREMPALDRLQASLGGSNFAVVPVSVDHGGLQVVAKFYNDIGIRNLPIYVDTSSKAIRELGAIGLPTTLILDRDGQEVARVVGPAEWDAPGVAELLTPIIAKQGYPIKLARRDEDRSLRAETDSRGPLARALRWLSTLLAN